MIVGAVLDNAGRPICCQLWPGNTSDAQALIPIVDRLKERFDIQQIRVVAERGMISKETIKELRIKGRRYTVCYNEDQARKERADREAIVQTLRHRLERGDKSLIGNKGYQRLVKTVGKRFEIDNKRFAVKPGLTKCGSCRQTRR